MTLLPLLALALPAKAHITDQDDALAQEISRAISSLQMEDYPRPYYISLRLSDNVRTRIEYDLGFPAARLSSRERVLTTEVRVGSPSMDNHPMGARPDAQTTNVAYGGDPFTVTHEAWRTIDEAYKRAVADYLSRQAQRVERGKADYETADFSPEPQRRHQEAPAKPWEPDADFEQGMRGVSEVMRGYPRFLGSALEFEWRSQHVHRLDSEGSRVATTGTGAWLEVSAQGTSLDGMRLNVRRRFYAARPEELASWDEVKRQTGEMAEELETLTESPSTSPFAAPAILDPSVAGGIFAAMASRLEGEEQRNPQGGQTFRKELGTRVLPQFLSLVDDPTKQRVGRQSLSGHYDYDEEGVPAQPVTLIKDGVLKSFLLSRYPVVGLAARSNGHGRAEPGRLPTARPANLIVSSSRSESEDGLVRRLREICKAKGKPYGLIVRRILSWAQQAGTGEHQSFRGVPEEVFLVEAATGKRTLVRGLDIVDTPLALLSKIEWTGREEGVTNFQDNEASGILPLGVVSPSLLVSEIELQRSEGKPLRPPILNPPQPR